MSEFSYMAFEVFGQKLVVRAPRTPQTWQAHLAALMGDYSLGQFDEVEPNIASYDIIGVEWVQDALPWHVTYDKYTHMLADETQLLTHLEWRLFTAGVWYGPAAISVHGGAVSHVEGTLVLPGVSGSGKTTLSLALTTVGWEYLTDDICRIEHQDEELVALPCRRCCHLDARANEQLIQRGLTLARPVAQLPENYTPPLGARIAPIRWIVLPQFQPEAPLHISRLTQAETAAGLLDAGLQQVHRTLREHRVAAIAAATQATGFRLRFPDLASGLAALRDITECDTA